MPEDPPPPSQLNEIAARLDYLEESIQELIARTYSIERHFGLVRPPAPIRPVQTPPVQPPPVQPPPVQAPPVQAPPVQAPPEILIPEVKEPEQSVEPPRAAAPGLDLESMIGGNWFNRIGIFAIILGAGFFLKYAFENQWVGPRMRVMIGVFTGVAFLIGGEQMRKRGYRYYAHGLSGGGIAILYLAFFASFAFYHLIEQVPAFLLMSGVTAAAVLLAARYDALVIAILGLFGGFLTPVMLSTGRDNQVGFFSYLVLLNLGVLGLAWFKQWRVLNYLAYTATVLLSAAWLDEWYAPEKLWRTVFFFSILFVIYSLIAVFHNITHRRPIAAPEILLILINAALYFGTTYELMEDEHHIYLGLFAVLMSAFYLGLGYLTYSRDREDSYLILTFIGLASVFLTLAVPIQLDQHWVTMGWAIEGTVLTWIGLRTRSARTRYAALLVFGIGLLHWLGFDLVEFAYREGLEFTPLLNRRGASSVVLIASLSVAAWLYHRLGGEMAEKERLICSGSLAMTANALAVTWLSLDVRDYFQQSKAALLLRAGEDARVWVDIARLDNLKHFALTALWSIYGGAMLLIGLARRVKALRFAAFALLGMAGFKALTMDAAYHIAPWHNLFFNATFGAFALLIAVLALGYWRYQRADGVEEDERSLALTLLLAAANLFALVALSLEANGYFSRQIEASAAERAPSLASMRQFTLTALWSIYGALLLAVALGRRMAWLRWGALALFAVGVIKVIFADSTLAVGGRLPLLNQAFGAYAVLIAALACGVWLYSRADGVEDKERRLVIPVLVGAANLLAILALSLESNDYFVRELAGVESGSDAWQEQRLGSQLALSVIWAIYGGGMLVVGLWRSNRMLRIMALGLLVLTTGKVFFVDLSSLDRIYRIISFIVLGAILMLVSFLYQRLQKRTTEAESKP